MSSPISMDEIHPHHVLLDIFLVIVAWIPVIVLTSVDKPKLRGFFCNDETIAYPYHKSTVPPALLYGVGYGVPIMLILLIELYRTYLLDKKIQGYAVRPAHQFRRRPIPAYISRVYLYLGYFIIGGAFTSDIHNIAKYTVGRLRPHFLDVCKPEMTAEVQNNCDNLEYTVDFECKGTNIDLIHDARLSFPSGHAAVSVYTMLYAVLYLEARADFLTQISQMIRPIFQLMLLSFAVATSLSRISDNKHHPTDVMFGAVLGGMVALVLGLRVLNILQPAAWTVAVHPGTKKDDSPSREHQRLLPNPYPLRELVGYRNPEVGYSREMPYMDEGPSVELSNGERSSHASPAYSSGRPMLQHTGL